MHRRRQMALQCVHTSISLMPHQVFCCQEDMADNANMCAHAHARVHALGGSVSAQGARRATFWAISDPYPYG